jgi:hypothetical protein
VIVGTVANRISALLLAAGAGGPGLLNNEISVPVFGVTALTVLACAFGTFAAIGYDDSRMPRGRQLFLGLSTVIMAAAAVGSVPEAMGWGWSSGGVQGGFGALTAFAFYYLLPPAIKRSKEMVASFNLADWLPGRKAAATPPPAPPTAGKPGAIEDPDK